MNYSLFSTQSSEAGFRLHNVEIYNWGTFDRYVCDISPEGSTTLLTGANGSGKTTYVDAILTLLVPERKKRLYNQSSGATRKDERTEESYVLGEYGDIEEEGRVGKITQRLRPNRTEVYSILLAVFRNEDQFVTLAQTRWFAGSELKRSYMIAHKPLGIEKDILPLDPTGQWRKRLKERFKAGSREMVEFFDSPGPYAQKFCRIFGMRSEKALTLFSQTVGLKVLGNLDDFIRNHMLEESNVEEEFFRLKENYTTLLNAHRAIEKAEEQLRLLGPVVEKARRLDELSAEQVRLSGLERAIPPWFSVRKKDLLEVEIERQERQAQKLADDLETLTAEIGSDRARERDLDFDIRKDETGQRIQGLENAIHDLEADKQKREKKLKGYNDKASKARMRENPDEALFVHQIEEAEKRGRDIDKELPGLTARQADRLAEKKLLTTAFEEKATDLKELEGQKNNITGRVAEIRRQILEHVGATEADIPFVGELIQVLPRERQHWEGAIEKVLHNFALRLIVPEKYYKDVNRYVNDTNLRGRIVYHRVKPERFLNDLIPQPEDSLFSKIEIRRDSPYAEWVENRIRTDYDYLCTDDLDIFSECDKGVTSQGLVKNRSRHEKDDRPHVLTRDNYVLGWDTKEKIRHTREVLKELDRKIKAANQELDQLKRHQARLSAEKEALIAFRQFDTFAEIDWQSIAIKIQKLEQDKALLEKSSDRINELKRQQAALKSVIDEKVERERGLTVAHHDADRYLTQCREALKTALGVLDAHKGGSLTEIFSALEEFFGFDAQGHDLHSIDAVAERCVSSMASRIRSNERDKGEVISRLEGVMREFKRPSDEELLRRFPDWLSDTHKLSDSVTFVSEYLEMHERISGQELSEHKNRFKKYLNEDMITRIADFQTMLHGQEEAIVENIEALNRSLKRIDFRNNPKTYIQLKENRVRAKNIHEFQIKLREWKPNLAEYERTKDDTILEQSFLKIQALIEELSTKEAWRREVTDVRNWLEFTAKEFYREGDRVFRTYDNTGKLSGGEKAQLTYTILGSAIAYQFGISRDGLDTRSFRFICVDESFSNQDDEKSTYLMDLCKQLHLQLLVVTPNDKTHIVEPYIARVHFVQRKNNRNSLIYDMPIAQYQAEKQKWQT
ncbi:ATP-binding protein [Geobacter sp.]|uniref:ATP-binding protein n=1 Tax=Geobacter sp. TaxID=46610 RepID=UPI00260DAE9E|nr:SbcC/MukB-like Walker B domain-containing protein [Geobacter sp.]